MAKNGPILVVEDNPTDSQALHNALNLACTGNEIISLTSADETLKFLKNPPKIPFLILCDVNLPKMDGIELKKRINTSYPSAIRIIPFIFYSSYSSDYAIMEAYNSLTIQGYFQKNNALRELPEVIKTITDYWRLCRLPLYPGKSNHIIHSHSK